jgi:hypothetical protein
MNRDINYNNCDAPEEDYKAPPVQQLIQVPIVPKRLPKANDPEAIRNRLKSLSPEELQAAFESIDIQRLLIEEFGPDLETAKSSQLITDFPPPPKSNKKSSSSTGKKMYDIDLMKRELALLTEESKSLLHENITSQFRS